jgi:hypothetical protein
MNIIWILWVTQQMVPSAGACILCNSTGPSGRLSSYHNIFFLYSVGNHISIQASSVWRRYYINLCSKKRQNFLNKSPTSREGALRLLIAPSGRFWQQTAICPVSLWGLVVELHPLNWARAQAVCLKSSIFFWTSGDSGKCDKRTARHHRKCVPASISTMEETLGTVYRQ